MRSVHHFSTVAEVDRLLTELDQLAGTGETMVR
jgi:hypothetical protein